MVAQGKRVYQPQFSPISIGGLALWLMADQGLLTDGASAYASASSQSLSITSNATLVTGDVDYFVAGWFNLATTGADRYLIAKGDEYGLRFANASNQLRWYVNNNDAMNATTFGAISTGTWYFVIAYHDSVNDLMGISVNGGVFDTASTTTPGGSGTNNFTLGSRLSTSFWNGNLDSMCIGKDCVGGIAALATSIRNALYNSGSGVRYADLTSSQKTAWGLVSWYDFQSSTTLVTDSHGSNTLTNNNGVTFTSGIVSSQASQDGDPITTWVDQVSNKSVTQSIATKRPTLKLAIKNNRSIVRFDGTDDFLVSSAFPAVMTQPLTTFYVFQLRSTGGSVVIQDSITASASIEVQLGTAAGQFTAYAGATGNIGAENTNYHVLMLEINAASSKYRFDGGAVTNITGNIGTRGLDGVRLAAGTTGANCGPVDMAELLLFSGILPTDAKNQVFNYLNAKWVIY